MNPTRAADSALRAGGAAAPASADVIAVRLRDLGQLFDALDPAPLRERDLDPHVAEYIFDSVQEMPGDAAREIVIQLDRPAAGAAEPRPAEEAVQAHFARRSASLQRNLRRLLQRGRTSLCIGLLCLAAFVGMAQLLRWLVGENTLGNVLHESFLIGGWVAMWRPLEIFLYDWWPIVGERRVCDRLSRTPVRTVWTAA